MLKRGASQERMEKHLKEINESNKERSLRQITNNDTLKMCSKCDTPNGYDSTYCSKCGKKL
jgi:ribosomal protein L40E